MKRDPTGNVPQKGPHSRPDPSQRVDPCRICLSVYRPCCIGLSQEDRVRLLSLREQNFHANGHSSAMVRDGRHKRPNRNYSSSRSSLGDVAARGQRMSATPSGNDYRNGKKRQTRRSRKGKKVPTESESEQVPSRERRIIPGGLVAVSPKFDRHGVKGEDPDGERGINPYGGAGEPPGGASPEQRSGEHRQTGKRRTKSLQGKKTERKREKSHGGPPVGKLSRSGRRRINSDNGTPCPLCLSRNRPCCPDLTGELRRRLLSRRESNVLKQGVARLVRASEMLNDRKGATGPAKEKEKPKPDRTVDVCLIPPDRSRPGVNGRKQSLPVASRATGQLRARRAILCSKPQKVKKRSSPPRKGGGSPNWEKKSLKRAALVCLEAPADGDTRPPPRVWGRGGATKSWSVTGRSA